MENYRELKERLKAEGHTFSSETDAETVSHLIEAHYEGDLTDAVVKTWEDLEGHFTFVVIHRDHPSCWSAPGARRRRRGPRKQENFRPPTPPPSSAKRAT